MFFTEYSLLAMFDTYPASKCTTKNMYTCVCAGLVVIVSLRTALGSLKEEEERRRRRTICVGDDFVCITNILLTIGWLHPEIFSVLFSCKNKDDVCLSDLCSDQTTLHTETPSR